MYFPKGGSTLQGIAKPGEIVWSRIFIEDSKLKIDLGRAKVITLPKEETQRRLDETTPQWPIMHAVTYGVSRDQMMARHQANHINVAYAKSAKEADNCLYAKAELAKKWEWKSPYVAPTPKVKSSERLGIITSYEGVPSNWDTFL